MKHTPIRHPHAVEKPDFKDWNQANSDLQPGDRDNLGYSGSFLDVKIACDRFLAKRGLLLTWKGYLK